MNLALTASFLLAGASGFAATRTAVFALPRADRPKLARSSSGRALVASLDGTPHLEATLGFGEAICTILAVSMAAQEVLHRCPEHPWIALFFAIPIVLLIPSALAKAIARRSPLPWAELAAPPLMLLHIILSPIRNPLLLVVAMLARIVGAPLRTDIPGRESTIRDLLERGTATGSVAERERDIVEAVFEFGELTIGRLMTPRADMISVSLSTSWNDLLEKCRNSGYSRVPVYQQRNDEVLGVLLLKDLLKISAAEMEPLGPHQLRSLLLPPTYVPQTKPANAMLREFLAKRQHMAFVVDEHGTVVGLVTLDDLLTELVGEFLDPAELTKVAIVPEAEGAWRAKGWTDLEDLQEETKIHLPRNGYHTLGGFIFHVLGRLPHKGDAIIHGNYRFQVVSMEGRRIEDILVQPGTDRAGDFRGELA